jgi:hypothetical protein
MVLWRRHVVLLRGTHVMRCTAAVTAMLHPATESTVVHAAATETATVVHAPTTETATVMHAATAAHMAATHMSAATTASVTMKCWQIRTQTQKDGCCQYSRHSAHPGMHRCSSPFGWWSAVSLKYTTPLTPLTIEIDLSPVKFNFVCSRAAVRM